MLIGCVAQEREFKLCATRQDRDHKMSIDIGHHTVGGSNFFYRSSRYWFTQLVCNRSGNLNFLLVYSIDLRGYCRFCGIE